MLGVSGAAREGTVAGPGGNVDAKLALADGVLGLVGGVSALALQTVLLADIVPVHDIDAPAGGVAGTKGEPLKIVTEPVNVICGRIGSNVCWLGRLIAFALCCLMCKEIINGLLTNTLL